MHKNLRSFIQKLKAENELIEIETEVDAYLEIAEIHRRVIEEQGKALLFKNVKGSRFPVVTNLFGTNKRIDLGFGPKPLEFVKRAVEMVEILLPPKPKELWAYRDMAWTGLKLGTKNICNAPVLEMVQKPANLEEIPLLQLWHEDGGHFVTLPLVYTESPTTGKHNLGMYRIQRYDKQTTGIHWQIHKGGGFHYFEAEKMNRALPINVFIGGPPAMILAAIAPLPEDVPELMLASLLNDGKVSMAKNPLENGLRLLAEAEFIISGKVPPNVRRPEGPFGDHTGYYSMPDRYPIVEASAVTHRRDAVFPATVVGLPPQEDYYLGKATERVFLPLLRTLVPDIADYDLPIFGAFHNAAFLQIRKAYPLQARRIMHAVWGAGQMAWTKNVFVVDEDVNVHDAFAVLRSASAWCRPESDIERVRGPLDILDHAAPARLRRRIVGSSARANRIAMSDGKASSHSGSAVSAQPKTSRHHFLAATTSA